MTNIFLRMAIGGHRFKRCRRSVHASGPSV
jgi:hypothetical protein